MIFHTDRLQISAPANLTVLMSAVRQDATPGDATNVHNFLQKIPIQVLWKYCFRKQNQKLIFNATSSLTLLPLLLEKSNRGRLDPGPTFGLKRLVEYG